LLLGIGFSGFMALKHWLKETKQRKDPQGTVPLGANFFRSN
jgi:hypothetical protein